MRRSRIRMLVLAALLVGGGVYYLRNSSPVDAATLERDPVGPLLRVAIVGASDDSRVPATREALAHWNQELARLGRRIHFDSGTVRGDSIPDEMLRDASGEAVIGRGPATSSHTRWDTCLA